MPGFDETAETSAKIETREINREIIERKTFLDYFSIGISTFGVGFIPLAPGTWGSAVGVLIYLLFARIEAGSSAYFLSNGWLDAQITAWLHVFNLTIFLLFCLLGIWASGRATRVFQDKDPQKVVVDEVIGQLIVFLFVPFDVSWKLVFAGFLLFRLFDIWKPYPIDSLQNLPAGIGVCADDIVAGVYGGVCLSILYALSLTM
ncbi:MAG TPA: phosphatidylglycerophosphatase A [Pyrinomonadaceae bacterium]|nr:phosphatidylglycerophosphatase A [Pyrinomonadaceae bacterium]